MAGIAEVQGGSINALRILLTNLRHLGCYRNWITSTEYTNIGCAKLKPDAALLLSLYDKFSSQYLRLFTIWSRLEGMMCVEL
jgi:hypothetical protein